MSKTVYRPSGSKVYHLKDCPRLDEATHYREYKESYASKHWELCCHCDSRYTITHEGMVKDD